MTATGIRRTVLRTSVALVFLSIAGCDKEDEQPNGKDHKRVELSGTVLHHDRPIAFARVYLKKNTSAFPGVNPGLYDFSIEADSDAMFRFHNLAPASYYLYGEGWDAGINDSVYGGVPTTITGTSQTQRSNVPVTE